MAAQNGSDILIPDTFVGFDLGHAETAVSTISSHDPNNKATVPLKLGGDTSWPTAIGISGRGTDIGHHLADVARETDCKLHVGFKARPDESAEAGNLLAFYGKELFTKLSQCPEISGKHHIMLGCPTGWKAKSVKEYQKIMEGFSRNGSLEIARESRAAMYQALQHWVKLSMRDSFYNHTLVIDVGSSTMDMSAAQGPGDDPIDTGVDLGCGMLDQIFVDFLPQWQADPSARELLSRGSGRCSSVRCRCRNLCQCCLRACYWNYTTTPVGSMRRKWIAGRRGIQSPVSCLSVQRARLGR